MKLAAVACLFLGASAMSADEPAGCSVAGGEGTCGDTTYALQMQMKLGTREEIGPVDIGGVRVSPNEAPGGEGIVVTPLEPGASIVISAAPPTTTTTTTTTTPQPVFAVLHGPCVLSSNGRCVESPQYPGSYKTNKVPYQNTKEWLERSHLLMSAYVCKIKSPAGKQAILEGFAIDERSLYINCAKRKEWMKIGNQPKRMVGGRVAEDRYCGSLGSSYKYSGKPPKTVTLADSIEFKTDVSRFQQGNGFKLCLQ